MTDCLRFVPSLLSPAMLLACLAPAMAQSQTVSPSDRSSLEGSSFTSFPLGRPNGRFQFLHQDLPGGMTIHGHAFRRDATQLRAVVDGFAAELEVTLSMSPRTPSTASATFSDNVGPSPTVVLPRTTLVFPATNRPALDPSPTFDLVIPYAVPFVLPQAGGTLCVDTVMHANVSAAGVDRSLSVYLDAHELSTSVNEQPGFRSGGGCAPIGAVAQATAAMTLRRTATNLLLDCAARDGSPDKGNGQSFSYLAFGASQQPQPWPFRPSCVLQSSTEHWFVLGRNDATGACDGALTWPILPAGYRVYLQVGSIELGGSDLVFSDLTQMMTPPAAPTTLPAVRIAASTNRASLTGAVSASVPVTLFF